jgi:hypothetical protein
VDGKGECSALTRWMRPARCNVSMKRLGKEARRGNGQPAAACGTERAALLETWRGFGWSTGAGGRHVKLGMVVAELYMTVKHAGRRCSRTCEKMRGGRTGVAPVELGYISAKTDTVSSARVPARGNHGGRARGGECYILRLTGSARVHW